MSKRLSPNTSKYICSLALLKISALASMVISIGVALGYFYSGREQMIVPPLLIAFISICGWCYLHFIRCPSIKLSAWVIAGTLYFGLIAGIVQHPAYMIQISMSLPFVMLVLGSGGQFLGASIAAVIIVISVLGLAPPPEVLSTAVVENKNFSAYSVQQFSIPDLPLYTTF